MTKPLSQLLEEIEVESADRMSLRNDLAKLKRVAIELAKACENVSSNGRVICLQLNEKDVIEFNKGSVQFLISSLELLADRGISRAKDIIGEVT